MKTAPRHQTGRNPLELIEEAVHLLRTAPPRTLAAYFIGTLPFVLGLLYFWADMSRNPFARQRVVEATLGITLLFVWMKTWQSVFALQLRAFLSGNETFSLGVRRTVRIALRQATLQPTGLFLLPLSALPVFPFPWVYAFYQSVTALGDDDAPSLRALIRRGVRQAKLWPSQNIVGLICLSLFGGFAFLNCCVGCGMLPHLVKMLFGVETVFSRSSTALLNTTFFATMWWLTYLCVDPILKSIYVLRCFYGDSIQSGADLRAELRQVATPGAARYAIILLIASLCLHSGKATAQESAPLPAPARQSIAPEELDRAIDQTIKQRKYTWRIPRERAPVAEPEASMISEFFNSIGRMIRDSIKATVEWIGKMLDRIFGGRRLFNPSGSGSLSGWAAVLEILLYGLIAVVFAAIAVMLYRVWRNREARPQVIQTEALATAPDLTDENVGADQLPEDGWTRLARELLARGEFRLALRAFYLSSLAHLAARNLISLARFKSNHEYERELGRRAHSLPALRQVFGENVHAFDRVWYGTHDATNEVVTQFAANVERIKTGA